PVSAGGVAASTKMDQDTKTSEADWAKSAAQSGAEPGAQHEVTVSSGAVPARRETGLPAVIRKRRSAWRFRALIALAILIAGGGTAYYWWQRLHPPLPPGIAFGNGRLEANEINIDTKYAARIAEMFADQGDLVKAGQVVARMDTREIQASLKLAQAQVEQAQRAVDEAN